MRAAVVEAPGGPEALVLRDLPKPAPRPGWTRVRVRAFGLNRAELMTRRGESGDAVRFPRVLGIEAVGTVDESVDDEAPPPGTTVASVMGGMGRAFDGGYAEYTLLPTERLMPLETHLDWDVLGALPETFLTARGSLDVMGLREGQSLLVRGAGSSVGLAALGLGAAAGLHVIGTTRDADKADFLRQRGADDVLVDQGRIAGADVDGVLDLVGGPALLDALNAVVPGGIVCATGLLGGTWVIDQLRTDGRDPHRRQAHDVRQRRDRGRALGGGAAGDRRPGGGGTGPRQSRPHLRARRHRRRARLHGGQPGHRQGGRHPLNA